ncbi:nucleoside hydrolase [Paenibacillus paeoniae]|uniref:Nucleoside hydrolase n=1 Tax=Paenibacillus paeoniae TaxID=2292705 RepID=A0A371PIA7_9BACL|nr:nucleoside hydrolase [Paenibacillus paeoniae]REK75864.1 nucleoside hydrolase [Paenibacillus paeoniae]
MKLHRMILDTDIGTDVDDAMAVALSMFSPEIQVEGITTVYGDVVLRSRMVKKILQMGGREDIKIYAGVEQTLLRNREIWWLGHEGEGILHLDERDQNLDFEEKHAVDFIIETVMNNPGEITLVPIGPLTNIAAAMIREPRIAAHAKEIILMGGVSRIGSNAAELDYYEHNISRDPESASIVFGSGAKIVMVGLDVTRQVLMNRSHLQRLTESGEPLNLVLVKLVERWLEWYKHEYTAMNDPLAVALLINRSFVKTKKMKVHIEYDHRHPTGQTIAQHSDDANVEVCVEVDSEGFMNLLLDRLCSRKS